jgi:hypothetical protein
VEVNPVDRNAVAEYCREIERYLCQKNGGHLVRVVGPAFDQVRDWAERGIPLKIAFRGIDQCCERYVAKGPRRRPVRIEFCAADILELFDDWRRAVGVSAEPAAAAPARKPRLAAHVERVVARLIAARGAEGAASLPAGAVDEAVRVLDAVAEQSHRARGEARDALVERLAELDARLLRTAAESLDEGTAAKLRQEAEEELAAFGQRMPPEARAAAVEAAFLRLVRESFRLPRISLD